LSVINQVLLELEKRRASGAERGTLPDHVRALPESGSDHRAWWFTASGFAALALTGVAWLAFAGFGWAPRSSTTEAAAPPGSQTVQRVIPASAAVAAERAPGASVADSAEAVQRASGRLSLQLSSVPAAQQAPEPESAAARRPMRFRPLACSRARRAPIAARRLLRRLPLHRLLRR